LHAHSWVDGVQPRSRPEAEIIHRRVRKPRRSSTASIRIILRSGQSVTDHPRSSIIQGVIISSGGGGGGGGAPGSVVVLSQWSSNGTGPPRCFAPNSSSLPIPSLSPRQHGQQAMSAQKKPHAISQPLSHSPQSLLTLTHSQPHPLPSPGSAP